MSDIDMGGWMPLVAFCEKYEQRQNTVHKRVADGAWERGVVYSSPTGGVGYVHEARAVEWLTKRGKLPLQV